MSVISDMAAVILAEKGETVSYTAGDAGAVGLQAVVGRYGLGYCPTGWPADAFQNQAKHAEIRVSPADCPAMPSAGDVFQVDATNYTVRIVQQQPKTGPEILWWICLCAADQRGRY